MILEIYELMVAFLKENAVLVALIMTATEYLKRWLKNYPWYEAWHSTVVAFVLGFILAIPSTGFAGIGWMAYIASGVGLGLVATGIYKVGDSLAHKASRTLTMADEIESIKATEKVAR